ncbi:hypothetical protein F4819DRAFT_489247 [Hypoxylon fuscum]|nr:hypothetical protein F4819DRAFT_489247 [Hypoxylon fuscum]
MHVFSKPVASPVASLEASPEAYTTANNSPAKSPLDTPRGEAQECSPSPVTARSELVPFVLVQSPRDQGMRDPSAQTVMFKSQDLTETVVGVPLDSSQAQEEDASPFDSPPGRESYSRMARRLAEQERNRGTPEEPQIPNMDNYTIVASPSPVIPPRHQWPDQDPFVPDDFAMNMYPTQLANIGQIVYAPNGPYIRRYPAYPGPRPNRNLLPELLALTQETPNADNSRVPVNPRLPAFAIGSRSQQHARGSSCPSVPVGMGEEQPETRPGEADDNDIWD